MGRQTEFSLYLQPAFFSFPQCFPLTFESVSFTQRKISSKTPSSSFLEVEVTASVSRTVTAAFYFRPSKSVPFSDLASTQVWSSLLLSYHLVHFFPIFFLWFQSLDSSQLPPIKKKKKKLLGFWKNLESKVKSERKSWKQIKRLARVHQESWQFFWSGQMELQLPGGLVGGSEALGTWGVLQSTRLL